jgi:FKBP-type peptidyl-prolyl cis-trans isomerase
MKQTLLFTTAGLARFATADIQVRRDWLELRGFLSISVKAIAAAFLSLAAIGQELGKLEPKPEKSVNKTPASEAKATGNSKAEGQAFLATNAVAEGITVLPDGLQYRIIRTGTGAIPTTNDLIFIKYRGRVVAGAEFDHQSHFLTRSNGGIRGMQEALQRMKVGSRWQIFVPSALGFAEEGDPYHHIPPDSALSYDLELLSIAQPDDPQVGTGSLGHGLAGEYSERHPNENSNP